MLKKVDTPSNIGIEGVLPASETAVAWPSSPELFSGDPRKKQNHSRYMSCKNDP